MSSMAWASPVLLQIGNCASLQHVFPPCLLLQKRAYAAAPNIFIGPFMYSKAFCVVVPPVHCGKLETAGNTLLFLREVATRKAPLTFNNKTTLGLNRCTPRLSPGLLWLPLFPVPAWSGTKKTHPRLKDKMQQKMTAPKTRTLDPRAKKFDFSLSTNLC